MNENNKKVQQNKQKAKQNPSPAQMQQVPVRDPRSFGQYFVDKTFDAAGRELDRIEQQKPGTRRKLAGIASLTFGIGGVSAGIYLLTS